MRNPNRLSSFFETYTQGLKSEDLRQLFTRDAPDAYRFFTRHVDFSALDGLPRHKRAFHHVRLFLFAFVMKLSPARRIVYGASLLIALVGFFDLVRFGAAARPLGRVTVIFPGVRLPDGFGTLLIAFALLNLLVLVEVADRLLLKNDLEIARDIQQAMLPNGVFQAPGVDIFGVSRPANTVGGDFYEILPLEDGRVVVAVGDVVGKGSPAALLMALLLAILRTLVDEGLEPSELAARLNVQVSRHAPPNRFITLFYGVYDPKTGALRYVNAGHPPPLVLRASGGAERLAGGGVALGMFAQSKYTEGLAMLQQDDLLAAYSDGITDAENQLGRPFDDAGLEGVLEVEKHNTLAGAGSAVLRAVEKHTADVRLADDLTILLARRTASAPA